MAGTEASAAVVNREVRKEMAEWLCYQILKGRTLTPHTVLRSVLNIKL